MLRKSIVGWQEWLINGVINRLRSGPVIRRPWTCSIVQIRYVRLERRVGNSSIGDYGSFLAFNSLVGIVSGRGQRHGVRWGSRIGECV